MSKCVCQIANKIDYCCVCFKCVASTYEMKNLEEKLREASCVGDVEAVEELTKRGININAKHDINGWTALHWAGTRGHANIVRILLSNGADKNIQNEKGETPLAVTTDSNVRQLLGGAGAPPVTEPAANSSFTPAYLRNTPINGQVDIGPRRRLHHAEIASMPSTNLPAHEDELVLRVRISGNNDPDFIEVEIQKSQLSYSALMAVCCAELGVNASRVERLRKLPDTRLRNDRDARRLSHMTSLEIVLKPAIPALSHATHNGYQSITAHKDQTILY